MGTPEIFPPAENPLSARLARWAKEYAERAHVCLTTALREVCRMNPELAEASREETLHRKVHAETVVTNRGPFEMVTIEACERFSELVGARVIEKGISHKQAYSEIRNENLDLWQAARAGVLGEKPGTTSADFGRSGLAP